ncbi:rod shape-determining protein MreC [Tannockella kyphosi]|uniref:rod shape-determining protein MreC n=1 Tax=Tannockella kyphosi TaxID=2899121 RepID=UPI00201229CB|nr:rod shape-determining protein MreC [Tannockella kyphosi]
MNEKKDKQRKRILIFVVTVLLISIVSLMLGNTSFGIERMVRDSITQVEYYLVKRPIEIVESLFEEFYELKDVYDENESLKSRLDEYESILARNELLESEISELQELMNMDYLPIDYTIEYAAVQYRSITSWDSNIVIGLGSDAGIMENMAVVSSEGMIGIISEVSELSATVSLLSTENPINQIPVQINNGDEVIYGLLDKYNSEENVYEVILLSSITVLESGSKVYTSGLGGDGQTPSGIYIGDAIELELNSDGSTACLLVEPAVSFDDIRYVGIINRVTGDE